MHAVPVHRPFAGHLLAALALALLLTPTAWSQYHEDTRYGFKFKPPDEFTAVALTPNEFVTVAKYQSESVELGGEQGSQTLLKLFQVMFWPITDADEDEVVEEDEPEDDEGDEFDAFEKDLKKEPKEKVDPVAFAWEQIGAMIGPHTVEKTKTTRSKGNTIEERYLKRDDSPMMYYAAVLKQDDGVFMFVGDSFEKRFSKIVGDYSKATKSFQRIEKDGSTTGIMGLIQQSGDQDEWLQAQIDKLPPGWDHMKSDHYLYLFSADRNFMKEVAQQIESIRSEYEEMYPSQRPITAISIVRVFDNEQQYVGYGAPPNTNGFFHPVQKELVLFDRRPQEQMLETLNHEAFHQFIYYWAGELSPHDWYNEGHGEYFGGARMTRTKRVTEYGPRVYTDRMPTLRQALRFHKDGRSPSEGAMIPVRDLISWKRPDFYDGANIGRAYAQAWALVYMLRTSKKLEPEWEQILPNYLENLLAARLQVATKAMEEALENARKRDDGSEERISQEPSDYFGRINPMEIQDVTYEKTFGGWTDADWARFNEFYISFCDDL